MLNSIITYLKKHNENIFVLFSFLIIFSLPFSSQITSISIIGLAVVWVVNGYFLEYRKLARYDFFNFLIFYLLFVFGVLYSEDKKNAFFQLEQKFSLIALPVLFLTYPKISLKSFNLILYLFVFSGLILSLYTLVNACYVNFFVESNDFINELLFTNQVIAGYIGFHSTYFSVYIILAIIILLNFMTINTNKSKLYIVSSILLIFYFLFFLILLASRMAIISFAVLISVYFIRALLNKKYLFYKISVAVLVCFFAVFFVQKSNYLSNRLNELNNINTNELIGSNYENGISQRIFFWQNAVEIIKKSPIYGYGSGDVNIEFDKQYQNLLSDNPNYPESVVRAIHFFKDSNYNAHNQYLQILISFGIIGLGIFVFFIGRFFYLSVIYKINILFYYLIVVVFLFFTECLFERQYGLVLFVFITSLLLFQNKLIDNQKS